MKTNFYNISNCIALGLLAGASCTELFGIPMDMYVLRLAISAATITLAGNIAVGYFSPKQMT
jgi:hypothetical protein